ncbi:(4Fe-4S)-binding protein [Enterococcus thailandicus]|uniref:(4Fe-4S)-binding protein n=1 Tax=Enterococcus thailandicus TaxID=417368 RepID=UPI0022E596BB|nr:(4Fe-4S)-binding protein [Enterococcus thailandicus]
MMGQQVNSEHFSTEEELFEAGYRKYSGEKIDIFYNKEICIHSGNCVRGNAAVFEVGRRPWIMPDNASADESSRVIQTCPSGALKFIRKDEV